MRNLFIEENGAYSIDCKAAVWATDKMHEESLPHRADEAIRQNADLSGRLSLINMEPWEVADLKEIAKLGFSGLDITIEDAPGDFSDIP